MPFLGQCLLRLDAKFRQLWSYDFEKYESLSRDVANFGKVAGMIQDGEVLDKQWVAEYSQNMLAALGTVLDRMPIAVPAPEADFKVNEYQQTTIHEPQPRSIRLKKLKNSSVFLPSIQSSIALPNTIQNYLTSAGGSIVHQNYGNAAEDDFRGLKVKPRFFRHSKRSQTNSRLSSSSNLPRGIPDTGSVVKLRNSLVAISRSAACHSPVRGKITQQSEVDGASLPAGV